jgi:hypothetical protein
MSCIEKEQLMRAIYTLIGVTAAAALLGGCVQSQMHLSSDFGRAVRQDIVAQIADPDAHYTGDPAPGSNGLRVGLAQKRYDTGKVLEAKPPTTTTINIGTFGGGSGGSE